MVIYHAKFDLIGQYFVLRAIHLEFKFLFRVWQWVLRRFLLNLVRFADNSMSKDALAEDSVELIVVYLSSLALNSRLDVFLGWWDVGYDLKFAK